MATTPKRLAQALKAGTLEEALARVFIEELGWHPCDGAIATDGAMRIMRPGESADGGIEVVPAPDGRTFYMAVARGQDRQMILVDRDSPAPSVIERLALLAVGSSVREGSDRESVLRQCFDHDSLARAFLSDYKDLFEKYRPQIKARNPDSFLNRFLSRVLLVRFLQTKGWFEYKGQSAYLQALYNDWRQNPGPHLFYQRLALVFFYALDEPRDEARALIVDLVGRVPHIGGGVFSPEQYEQEFLSSKGVAVVPDDMFEDLLGPSGLLTHYDFTANEGRPGETVVAITPEAMGAVLDAFLTGKDDPSVLDTATLRLLCRNIVVEHLGAQHALDLPKDKETLTEWRDEVRDLHIIDGECRSGSYLVAALEELTDLTIRIELALGGEPVRSAIKRKILTENLRGLVKSDLAVQVSRFRLALAILAEEGTPVPLPDIRPVVKKGGTLGNRHYGPTLPAEGPRTEFKASFEWDPRRGARNPDLRFGCLKSVAAFLNSEGGTLYIGVVDSGVPVGMADDLALIEDPDPEDTFHNRFRELLKNHLDPIPLSNVTLSFQEMNGVTVAAVEVRPYAGVTYLLHKDHSGRGLESVFVRDGNRTLELRGRDRDRFVVSRNG